MHRLYKRLLAALLLGGPLFAAAPAAAETIAVPALTAEGTALGTMATGGDIGDLRFAVDVGSDVPEASYVWAIVGGARSLQRTVDGYWVPWNGDTALLMDNGFRAIDGRLSFKVLDEDIGADNQGITLGIGYRAGGVLKYGIYGILPDSGS